MFEVCISISKSPGNFGMTVHNAGYQALKINYIYKALQIYDLDKAMSAIRTLNIKGCSVSMPFKEEVIKHLDFIDESVEECGACNTVLNTNGELKGYNTDVIAISQLLLNLKIDKNLPVLILGAGGMAKAFLHVFNKLGYHNITIAARSSDKLKKTLKKFDVNYVDINTSEKVNSHILVNATPIGMSDEMGEFNIIKPFLMQQRLIIDSVVSYKPTKIIKYCMSNKINCIDGFSLSLNQAFEQFKIYTGKNPPTKIMKSAALSLVE